jgi:hypothetical protein
MNNPEHIADQKINEKSCQEESLAILNEGALEVIHGAGIGYSALYKSLKDANNTFNDVIKTLKKDKYNWEQPDRKAMIEAWQKTPAGRPSELRRSNSSHI